MMLQVECCSCLAVAINNVNSEVLGPRQLCSLGDTSSIHESPSCSSARFSEASCGEFYFSGPYSFDELELCKF